MSCAETRGHQAGASKGTPHLRHASDADPPNLSSAKNSDYADLLRKVSLEDCAIVDALAENRSAVAEAMDPACRRASDAHAPRCGWQGTVAVAWLRRKSNANHENTIM